MTGEQVQSHTANIYLVRHGETQENVEQIVQGQLIDCPLNKKGQAQARAVAHRLSAVRLDQLYVSPLLRARETAAAISTLQPDVEVTLVPELMEMSFGVLEGRPYRGDNTAFFNWLESRWAGGHFDDRIDEGESVQDVRARALTALERISADSIGLNVVVVTHGRLLRVLLASVLEGYRLEEMDTLLHRNTAVSHILYENGRYSAAYLASDEHLNQVV